MSYQKLFIKFQEFGYLPILIGQSGVVLSELLAWSAEQKRAGKSDSTLSKQVQAIKNFADFWDTYHHIITNKNIYRSYFEHLIHGDGRLQWSGVNIKTATTQIKHLNKFLTWISDQKGMADPNPLVKGQIGWVKAATIYQAQSKTSLLSHLFSLTEVGNGVTQRREIRPEGAAQRQSPGTSHLNSAAMSWDDYIKLIKHEKCCRNLLLWLFLGAGGLRISEALHLFIQDVQPNQYAELEVTLSDPRYGEISTGSPLKKSSRAHYLWENFNLISRDQLKPHSSQYLGWKGMRGHNGKTGNAQIIWLHSDFARIAFNAHRAYLQQRRNTFAQNPYYFINTARNKGKPLTAVNASNLLSDACLRLDIRSAKNPHSLRHFYGDTLHNKADVPLSMVQVAMRHKSSISTEQYTRPSIEALRERLKTAHQIRPPNIHS
jgi:site-specific recombinase XerD